jgi:hypothetical protein
MHHLDFSPAVLAVCLDLRSLADKAPYPKRRFLRNGFPRSLGERLTWNADAVPSDSGDASESARGAGPALFGDVGLDIMEAHSPADALSLLRIMRFDLGLIGADALGPVVPSLLEQIRIVAPGLKCIVVSSDMDDRRERSIREAGVLAIFEAPMAFAHLREVANHLVAAR